MSEKMQETIADVVAEMLGARTEFPFVYLMGEPDTPEVIDPKTKMIIEPRKINIRRVTVKELADRLKAALRRERGNAAKLRVMMDVILGIVSNMSAKIRSGESVDVLNNTTKIEFYAKEALSATPRNCDVGTVADQLERFGKWFPTSSYCDGQVHKMLVGYADWAHMPYEEGGAK